MYLACDNGVYFADMKEDSLKWSKLNKPEQMMPNAMVFDIDINYATNEIYAGTMARGIWKSSLISTHANEIRISKSERIMKPFKVDGQLVVGRKKVLEITDKIIITSGSEIILKRKSKLILKKSMIRDEKNVQVDPGKMIQKKKGASLIFTD